MELKEKILSLLKEGRYPSEVARILKTSRQRVHQIRTGYVSPSAKLLRIEDPAKLKILTARKRAYLNMSEEEFTRIRKKLKPVEELKSLTKRKREWLSMTDEEYKESKLKDVSKFTTLNKRKRAVLNIPTGKVYGSSGGRDHRRELVRMRDNHTCQICGLIWKRGFRSLDVHHIDEDSKKTRQMDSVEEFKNMITLCHSCHSKLHARKAKIPLKALTKIGAVVQPL